MADSLFDKRYRYDFIYPRGRSGETLRAVDIEAQDRPVVIKRPAALDAPPIRAGQEVSINNERRALKALAGHPVLTPLLGEGQFMVGGVAHQYIVMERAEGTVVAEAVQELNAIGERLPMLEILVIVDNLLDLLEKAHAKGIVYNDVDAKHLFWSRERYQLKVIDWGNAIFLEGDEMTPQGISRQTDVFQVGQLLYYLVTGGRRPDVPRDAGPEFRVDFGDDARRVHSRLQEIISRALHPAIRLRYGSIATLRADLASFRQPLERERNNAVATVTERLKRDDLSKNDLRSLKTMIESALQQDPGYPPAREVSLVIQDRLRDLAVEADLDAARIYMDAGSWPRAHDLLLQLRERAGSQTAALINFLIDVCDILQEQNAGTTPALQQALAAAFKGQMAQAAQLLLTEAPSDDRLYRLQWLVAERVSSHFPDVMLLRPNLYRLNLALQQLEKQGYSPGEPRSVLTSVEQTLDRLAGGNIDLPGLRDGYRSVVEQLSLVNPVMQTFALQHQFDSRQLPLNSLDRAQTAAMALADAMHVIGRQATASPRDATNALDLARSVDPTNPVWDDVQYLLNRLYERLQACQTYVPNADGTDIQVWLKATQQELAPFVSRLFDDLLARIVKDLAKADRVWEQYRDAVIQGNRDVALDSVDEAARLVATISPTLSAWFRHLRVVLEGAAYIERHSIPNAVGRALADGWEAFDRGRLSDSERLGIQAYEAAKTPAEYEAARRLQELSILTREWVERNAVNNPQRTQAILDEVEKRFSPEERETLDDFTQQMPSIETYLKAMTRSLVEVFRETSTAALRLLYIRYVLLSALEVHENRMADGDFWREAALRTLGDYSLRHPALRALDEFTTRKRELNSAQALFNQIIDKSCLPDLEGIRRQLEGSAQARLLAPGIQSIRDLEVALRHWNDGDFRNAGLKLEQTIKGITDLEKSAGFTLSGYRAWVMELMAADAELLVQFREARGIIEQRPDEPNPKVQQAFHHLVDVTNKLLGEEYSGTLRNWRDTYDSFLSVFTAEERRSRRMDRMNELFRAMFIDRHPAYGLFRHWYDVLERSPEFPAPPTADPVPRIAEQAPLSREDFRDSRYDNSVELAVRPSRFRTFALIAVPIVILLAIGSAVLLSSLNQTTPMIELTITATPNSDVVAVAASPEATETADEAAALLNSPSATPPAPTATMTPIPPTATTPPASPTPNTPTATIEPPTATATLPPTTPAPTVTPTLGPPTATPLPPGGVTGTVNLFNLMNALTVTPDPDYFLRIDGGYRFGRGMPGEGDLLNVTLAADDLDRLLGNNAPSRIRRMDVEMALRTFNPTTVSAEDLVFGALLQNATNGNNVGLRVQLVVQDVINLYQVINGRTTFLAQRTVNAPVVRLRIERDLATGNVSLFYNDERFGDPIPFGASDVPVQPAVFVSDKGVVVAITEWRVILR